MDNEQVTLKSIPISNHYTTKEIDLIKSKRIVTPSFPLQQEIYANLISTDNWDTNKQIIADEYGKIRWNWSLLYASSSNNYAVTLPVYKSKKLTSMLIYFNNHDHIEFQFESVSHIIEATDNFTNYDVDELTFVSALSLHRLYEVQFSVQYKPANDWLIHILTNKNLASYFKDKETERCYTVIEIEGIPDPTATNGISSIYTSREVCFPINCPTVISVGGSATGGGLTITIEGSGGTTNPNVTDPQDPPEYIIKDEECKENNMTSEAVDCINNNTDVVFPCEEGSTQDVLDDIVEGLCTNASSTDGQNSQLEGPQEGEIDCADVNVELDGYDGIELSVFNNFNECLSNEEICELISTNSLSGIGIEKLECLGYPELNDCEIELLANNPHAFDELAENWLQSNLTTNILFGYNDVNECTDAFRHSFFNALNSWKLGENLAREFGEAHECVTTSELASEMDLFNNEVGYNILNQNAFILDQLNNSDIQIQRNGISDLYSVICSALQNGELRVFNDPLSSNPDNDSDVFLITSSDCSCILD